MLGIFQNRIYFAIMIVATVVVAAGVVYRGLDLGYSPRTYAEIIATPTPTPGPETPTRTPRPVPSSTPTRTLLLPPTPPLLFTDEFTDTRNFALVPNVQARVTITNSSLFVHFIQPTTAYLLSRSAPARGRDFTAQVEGRAVSFSRAEYGLLVWHGADTKSGADRFVYFLVNPAGSFRVIARNGQEQETEIVARTFSNTIRTGTAVNTLRVDGHASRLVFIVNGTIVADEENLALAEFLKRLDPDGKIGLIAAAEFGNLDVQFSNFRLYAHP